MKILPLYPVVNKKTGETKDLKMSVEEYTQWRKDNEDWDKDWSQGCAAFGEVGEWKDKLNKKNPSWNEVLKKVGNVPGSRVKKN